MSTSKRLKETVIGGEYWWIGDRGPYKSSARALSAARMIGYFKCYESHLLRSLRVELGSLQPGDSLIQIGSDYLFHVIESIPLEVFGIEVER